MSNTLDVPSVPLKRKSSLRRTNNPTTETVSVDKKSVSFNANEIEVDDRLISPRHWYCLVLILITALQTVSYFDNKLPSAKTITNSTKTDFIEGRARTFLEKLENFGPRPTGSNACEHEAVDLIVSEVKQISKKSKSKMEIDIQRPNGCMFLNVLKQQFTTCYRNITNIVVRMSSNKDWSDHSVLINCHFDSVLGSPGASDDGVSCAILLEIMRVISQSAISLKYDVIFLFNGAEEYILQASHGFITQHKWKHSIRTFVNVDAGGAGGRELLFQSGPSHPWLTQAYLKSSPRPHCNVFVQEAFESGIIPSNTDFRIFRDFGKIPGLDIAFVKNGYVYHTEFDQSQFIEQGAIQRAGENILKTLLALANSEFLAHPANFESDDIVFFDFLGIHVISFTWTSAQRMNLGLGGVILVLAFFNLFGKRGVLSISNLIKSLLAIILSLVSVAVFLLCQCQFVTILGLNLVWYNTPFLIIVYYILPAFLVGLFGILFWSKRIFGPRPLSSFPTQFSILFDFSSLVFQAVVLLILTYFKIRSSYFVSMFVIFGSSRNMDRLRWDSGSRETSLHTFIVHVLSNAVPTLYAIYLFHSFFCIIIPMMGRTGVKTNPEYLIAGLSFVIVVTMLLTFGCLVFITRSLHKFVNTCIVVCGILMFLCLFTKLGTPYSFNADGPRTRRIQLQHFSREIYGKDGTKFLSDSHILVTPQDFRGLSDLPTWWLGSDSKIPQCHLEDQYCSLPYLFPKKGTDVKHCLLIPTQTPAILYKAKLYQQSQTSVDFGIKMEFEASGSDHLSLFLTPRAGWKIISWSFGEFNYKDDVTTYFVFLSDTVHSNKWNFSVVLIRDESNLVASDSKLIIGLASHIIHGDSHSQQLNHIIDDLNHRRQSCNNNWRWCNTVQAWSSDFVMKEY